MQMVPLRTICYPCAKHASESVLNSWYRCLLPHFLYLVCIWPETHLTSAVNVVVVSNLRLSPHGLDKDHKLLTFHARKPKRNSYCVNTVSSDKVIFISWVCWHNVHRQKSSSKYWVKRTRSRTCICNFETCWTCFRIVGNQSMQF
jgi:hypothetical protein